MEDAEYPARRLGPIQSAAERVCPKSLTTEPAERLKENFDGIWSCACLYHLTKAEFRVCLESFHRILNPGGMVFVNLKLGTGERFIETPRDGYPGGAAAREKLGATGSIRSIRGMSCPAILHRSRSRGSAATS